MAWSHLQGTGAHSGAAATIAATYGSNLTSGSKLIAWIALNASSGTVSVTSVDDGNGNGFSKLGTKSLGTKMSLDCWALDTPAGDVGTKPTITAHCSGTSSAAGLSIAIEEVSGLMTGTTTAVLDGGAVAFLTSASGAASQPVPTYSTTASNEYLTQSYSDDGESVSPTLAGYTGTDGPAANADADLAVVWKNSTGGSETGSWSVAFGGHPIILGAVAFKLPGASPLLPPSVRARAGRSTVSPARATLLHGPPAPGIHPPRATSSRGLTALVGARSVVRRGAIVPLPPGVLPPRPDLTILRPTLIGARSVVRVGRPPPGLRPPPVRRSAGPVSVAAARSAVRRGLLLPAPPPLLPPRVRSAGARPGLVAGRSQLLGAPRGRLPVAARPAPRRANALPAVITRAASRVLLGSRGPVPPPAAPGLSQETRLK